MPTSTHWNRQTARRLILISALTLLWLTASTMPASAHGDHDARPLLRRVESGPYTVSLWQVYPDVGSAITPHLIVMFDGLAPGPDTQVLVELGSGPVEVIPSMTTPGAWETTVGVEPDDVVTVTISNNDGSWTLPIVIVPEPLTSILPMRLLIAISIFLATAVAYWAAGRTARAWRRPLTQSSMGFEN